MTDQGLKTLLGYVLRKKASLLELLACFKAEDIEKGLLIIPESLIETNLRSFILAGKYLKDYAIRFQNGSIFLAANLEIKQLGPLSARFKFTIDELHFNANTHKLFLSYQEDVRSRGNMMQTIAFKAFASQGPLLQSAAAMADFPFLQVSGYHAAVDLDQIKGAEKLPSSLILNYISCENGLLKLSFHI